MKVPPRGPVVLWSGSCGGSIEGLRGGFREVLRKAHGSGRL